MLNVKILGAGSIGNHMSNASRALGWNVTLVDRDPDALLRTRSDIYPGRYGAWDEAIGLATPDEAPRGGFDLIVIGTPPDNHVDLALDALDESPRALLVEKPVCRPDLERAQELHDKAKAAGVKVFVGYDHVVGAAAAKATDILGGGSLGPLTTLDVEFREYWGGIFAAHPWLDGPHDSYLGFWQRGGGASGEHSHALNLWQHFAHCAGAGRVSEVSATLDYVNDGRTDYDRLCLLNLKTENGLVGRTVQDVVTQPPRKWARLQGENGYVEWHCGFAPGRDAVSYAAGQDAAETIEFEKTRPEDFIQELRHIADALDSAETPPDLSLTRGLDTMLVIAAGHLSAQQRRSVRIDYDAGWTIDALQLT
jgi:predicted dehydrogenase